MRIGPFYFGYDAVKSSKRRRAPRSDVLSEDDHLNASERRKLVSTVRDLRRNCTLAAWMIRKHLDYVASFSFQSKTRIDDLDDHIERLVRWWSLPKNFDVAGRHGRNSFTRLAEAGRTVDGDTFAYKLRTGHLQGLEGDRIGNCSSGKLPEGYNIADFHKGIKCTKGGRPQTYILLKREMKRLVYDKIVPAKHIIPFAYWTRFDQVRGVSPLAAAVNTLQDTYEGITYALARAKVSQLFAMIVNRESAGELGRTEGTGAADDKSEVAIDLGKGPLVLQMGPDTDLNDAKFLESNQPAQEFQSFMDMMIALSLKALDIPYSFYNERFTNYSGARQALLLYEQSAEEKRKNVKAFLNELLYWRLIIWVMKGVLELPDGMKVSDLNWEWQPTGLPWIQPFQEIKADVEAVNEGLNSRTRICKRRGVNWPDIQTELEAEEKRRGPKGEVTPNANS